LTQALLKLLSLTGSLPYSETPTKADTPAHIGSESCFWKLGGKLRSSWYLSLHIRMGRRYPTASHLVAPTPESSYYQSWLLSGEIKA